MGFFILKNLLESFCQIRRCGACSMFPHRIAWGWWTDQRAPTPSGSVSGWKSSSLVFGRLQAARRLKRQNPVGSPPNLKTRVPGAVNWSPPARHKPQANPPQATGAGAVAALHYEDVSLTNDVILVLLTAFIGGAVFSAVGLPTFFGYVVTGIFLSPTGLNRLEAQGPTTPPHCAPLGVRHCMGLRACVRACLHVRTCVCARAHMCVCMCA